MTPQAIALAQDIERARARKPAFTLPGAATVCGLENITLAMMRRAAEFTAAQNEHIAAEDYAHAATNAAAARALREAVASINHLVATLCGPSADATATATE